MKNKLMKSLGLAFSLTAVATLAACDQETVNQITVAEIEEFQTAWGEGLVAISTAFANGEDYVTIAAGVLTDLYGHDYNDGVVLFNPTITEDVVFRHSFEDAASYFIGTSSPVGVIHAEDGQGFATNPWTAVNFLNDWQYTFYGETALGMGTVEITNDAGEITTVEKTMGWLRSEDGSIKLNLHHSAVPHSVLSNNQSTEAPATAAINTITVAELEAFQTAWGEGLVAISTAFANDEDYVTIAAGVLTDLYGHDYNDGVVLFNPTITEDVVFRHSFEDAASYFIGTSTPLDVVHAEDGQGFATNPWTAVNFLNDWQYIINGETAIGMGTVEITDADGNITTVEKTMGWLRATDGSVRLNLHHSAVPFGDR